MQTPGFAGLRMGSAMAENLLKVAFDPETCNTPAGIGK
jgi:hypothetical protein